MSRTSDRFVAIAGIALAFGFGGIAVGAALTDDDETVDHVEAMAAHEPSGDATASPESAPADDLGLSELQNGHHAEMELVQLDEATQAELDAQLELTREAARRYPTLADAVAAGYRRAGPYSPGLGIHYTKPSGPGLNADGAMDRGDLLQPMSIIYDDVTDDAKIAGFMYYSMSPTPPAGFAGDNDFWHYHTNVCIKSTADGIDAPFGADTTVEKSLCDEVGGQLLAETQYMVHVWTAPGYEVSDEDGGVFAEVNPKLSCPDGTYHQMDIEHWVDHPLNVCQSELESSES